MLKEFARHDMMWCMSKALCLFFFLFPCGDILWAPCALAYLWWLKLVAPTFLFSLKLSIKDLLYGPCFCSTISGFLSLCCCTSEETSHQSFIRRGEWSREAALRDTLQTCGELTSCQGCSCCRPSCVHWQLTSRSQRLWTWMWLRVSPCWAAVRISYD